MHENLQKVPETTLMTDQDRCLLEEDIPTVDILPSMTSANECSSSTSPSKILLSEHGPAMNNQDQHFGIKEASIDQTRSSFETLEYDIALISEEPHTTDTNLYLRNSFHHNIFRSSFSSSSNKKEDGVECVEGDSPRSTGSSPCSSPASLLALLLTNPTTLEDGLTAVKMLNCEDFTECTRLLDTTRQRSPAS